MSEEDCDVGIPSSFKTLVAQIRSSNEDSMPRSSITRKRHESCEQSSSSRSTKKALFQPYASDLTAQHFPPSPYPSSHSILSRLSPPSYAPSQSVQPLSSPPYESSQFVQPLSSPPYKSTHSVQPSSSPPYVSSQFVQPFSSPSYAPSQSVQPFSSPPYESSQPVQTFSSPPYVSSQFVQSLSSPSYAPSQSVQPFSSPPYESSQPVQPFSSPPSSSQPLYTRSSECDFSVGSPNNHPSQTNYRNTSISNSPSPPPTKKASPSPSKKRKQKPRKKTMKTISPLKPLKPGLKVNKKRKRNWTDDETRLLLKVYKDWEKTLRSKSKKKSVWESIYKQFVLLCKKNNVDCTDREVGKLRDRLRYLLKEYKKVKDNNKRSGANRADFEWYEELQEIVGDRECMDPTDVIESNDLEQPDEFQGDLPEDDDDDDAEDIETESDNGENLPPQDAPRPLPRKRVTKHSALTDIAKAMQESLKEQNRLIEAQRQEDARLMREFLDSSRRIEETQQKLMHAIIDLINKR